jgi:hypothetical protein
MAHGGARPGTGPKPEPRRGGRPRNPVNAEERNQRFDESASKVLDELFSTIKDIATGHKIAVYAKPRKLECREMFLADNTPIFVYDVPPDKAAAFYLVDRAAGKASVKSAESVDTELTLEVMMPGDDDDE